MYARLGRYDESETELARADDAYRSFEAYVRHRARTGAQTVFGGIGEALIGYWRRRDLDDAQLLSYFALFLLTGLDTLTHAIGNTLWYLGNDPGVYATLRAAPWRASYAFDETLRLWGPVRTCVRNLENEVAITDTVLPEGATVFLLVHAANRDRRRIRDPNHFRWDRRGAAFLSFGAGPHGCMGTALGRMIGTLLFSTIAHHCASLSATPGGDDAELIPSLPILGLTSVKLFATAAVDEREGGAENELADPSPVR
jgi:cytochrome P450